MKKPSEIIKEKIKDRGGDIKSRQIMGILDYLDEIDEKRLKNILDEFDKICETQSDPHQALDEIRDIINNKLK